MFLSMHVFSFNKCEYITLDLGLRGLSKRQISCRLSTRYLLMRNHFFSLNIRINSYISMKVEIILDIDRILKGYD